MSEHIPLQLPLSVHKAIKKTLKKFPEGKNQSAIKSALMSAQDHYGWLSPAVIEAVAVALEVPNIQVYEVATFYTLFHTKEVGKNVLAICTNVSCCLRGADQLYQKARELLNLAPGEETTADRRWTLKEVECLAACSQAPTGQLNGRYCGTLRDDLLKDLLDKPEEFI